MKREFKDLPLTPNDYEKLDIFLAGIEYKTNPKKDGDTWNKLNERLGRPYSDGEGLRCAVKDFQMKLRSPDGTPLHKYALPVAKGNEEKIIELQKERAMLSSLRVDLNKKIREVARNELLLEEFIRAVRDNEYYEPKFQRLKKQEEDTEHVFAFGDVHFGKEFKSHNNEYNISIVEKRFEDMYNEICDYVEENNVSLLHIFNTGDSVEGMHLRVSQLQSLQVGLVDQVIMYSNLLIKWIKKVSEVVAVKYYSVKSSNHSQTRPFGGKPNEFTGEDMERMITSHLKIAFDNKDSRVTIVESDDKFLSVDLVGYKILLLHGHEIKDHGNLLKNLAWKYRKFYDYAFVGHRHVNGVVGSGEGDTNNCEVIRVPSVMGSDEYADQLLLGSKAGAVFVKFNRRQGKRLTTDVVLN